MPASHDGVALFGGTFDPVHIGHLWAAVEVRDALGIDQIRLIPSCDPPHRQGTSATATDRLEMLRLATTGQDGITIDSVEVDRGGKSYMIDTLRSVREEIGRQVSLTLVLGSDAFRSLPEWYRWRELTDHAHILVLSRPGGPEERPDGALLEWVKTRQVQDPRCFQDEAHGLICTLQLTQLEVSSSRVRELLRAGRSVAYLTPDAVIRYIRDHGLYRVATDVTKPQDVG
jgi:nicotinate-nucleotide adenylyltransferase